MIDWHSHILPRMDDGSRDVFESISLIKMLKTQGVSTIIATPHFYANNESVEKFLERRKTSFELLRIEMPPEMPRVILGAEVRYYNGISRLTGLKELRVSDSNVLLLEMPMVKWTESIIRELIEMSANRELKITLAHIDRYINLQNREVWQTLYENGILMQANADFFISVFSRKKAMSFLEEGKINFIGSDCHNLTDRSPQIQRAFNVIKKRCGEDYLVRMDKFGHSML